MQTNETHDQAGSDTKATDGKNRYTELQQLVAGMAGDFEKFFIHGNKAAGTRVRNAMQELKTFAQNVRTEVQAIKNDGTKE
jgi:hypothetical protein